MFFVNVRYPDKPYGYTVLAVSLFFLGVIVLIAGALCLVAVPGRYAARSLGSIQLKGKTQQVGRCALSPLAG